MPSSLSFLKFEAAPIVKKVRAKNSTRKLSVPAVTDLAAVTRADELSEKSSRTRKVRPYPRTNLGKRRQISPARAFSPLRFSILEHQITARMNDQMPINISMKTLTVVAVMVTKIEN